MLLLDENGIPYFDLDDDNDSYDWGPPVEDLDHNECVHALRMYSWGECTKNGHIFEGEYCSVYYHLAFNCKNCSLAFTVDTEKARCYCTNINYRLPKKDIKKKIDLIDKIKCKDFDNFLKMEDALG